jgi:DNA-binding CsgD family transcriptional regulator
MNQILVPKALPNEAQLIQKLYGSVVDRRGFHPFLADFANSVNAFSGNLCSVNRKTMQLEYAWFSSDDQESLNAYMDTYVNQNMIEHDVVLNLAVRQYPGDCHTGIQALNTLKELDDRERWERSYQQFTRALGVMDTVWIVVHANEESVFLLTLNRKQEQGPYSETELEPIRRLVPHLRQAYQLYEEVSRANMAVDSMTSVLDAVARPMILLSDTCRVVHCNLMARDLLDSGKEFAVRKERLELFSRQQHSEMMGKVWNVVRSSMGLSSFLAETHYVQRQGKPDLILCISPIENLAQGGGALVTILDPEQRELPDAKRIACYFSLTKAESRLCEDLVKGLSLKEIALARHKSEATLRSTLKTIYEKTGLNRQGLLISGILSALIH